jgi:hypothetical protein
MEIDAQSPPSRNWGVTGTHPTIDMVLALVRRLARQRGCYAG